MSNQFLLEGKAGFLPVFSNDKSLVKFAMLVEGECNGTGAIKAAKMYGYSKQRYYQILTDYKKNGEKALHDKKKGPKTNFIRSDDVINQIIRYRFLDPDSSAGVIAQKMRQTGVKVSQRSVERTISEFGLQKKTSFIKVCKKRRKS